LKVVTRLLNNQALKKIGKYEMSNPIEIEDPMKSNIYKKVT